MTARSKTGIFSGRKQRAESAGEGFVHLDPLLVSKLQRLDLVARLVVEGFLTGLHRSPYHGFSVEFAEHRPYMPGDSLRHVDWKVYGKRDRYYVKKYEEETNLRAHLILDASASMGYKSGGAVFSKFDYGVRLAAALTYLMLHQQDSVGLLLFADQVLRFVPPRSAPSQLRLVLAELDKARVQGTTEIGQSLHHLAAQVRRRGLVILISDLMDDPAKILSGLKHFRHRKHEVIVFHVLDPAEIDFPFKEESVFIDSETQEKLTTIPWEIADEYEARLAAWKKLYKKECADHHVDYVEIRTDMPFDLALLRYLEKRKKLH
ncbi:MAG: DUF58 domain-containing protein [Candidatus Eisenbacteria bacterium]|uniref:DUF58 domain-containing protein n=1 Tax=Eiseniibacteriota bacterium TaxID=2212470 RepID=A0A948RSA6_UNCEI|nr:DUF58 domain-containing protein [Candidatus Eisenbacteria bacterium]MBU1948300.1 DUF58 domain-containing protein [Candidatus Eisenbacteria bacterium]MBU2690065.1 DUF58 domain-containing protein [Candidatus Eisenbacteria bacterium]